MTSDPTILPEHEEYIRSIRRRVTPWERYPISFDPDDPADVTVMTGAEMIEHCDRLLAVVEAHRAGDEARRARAVRRPCFEEFATWLGPEPGRKPESATAPA